MRQDFSTREPERRSYYPVTRGRSAPLPPGPVRWHVPFGGSAEGLAEISRSAGHSRDCIVYRDGILLPEVEAPREWFDSYAHLDWAAPPPRLVANLPKSHNQRIDLARSTIRETGEKWYQPLLEAHSNHLANTWVGRICSVGPSEAWYQLGRLAAFHKIDEQSLCEIFPHELWPVAHVTSGGRIELKEWKEIASEPLYLCPDPLVKESERICIAHWLTEKPYEGFLLDWIGGPFIPKCYWASYAGLQMAVRLWRTLAEKSHVLGGIRFLEAPWSHHSPLLQQILSPMPLLQEPYGLEALLEKAVENAASLDATEMAILSRHTWGMEIFGPLPELVKFPDPFSDSFAFNWDIWNLAHPVTQQLVRVLAAVGLGRIRGTLSPTLIGRVEDQLKNLPDVILGRNVPAKIIGRLRRIWSIARETKFVGGVTDVLPAEDEFVLETEHSYDEWDPKTRESKGYRPFGRPLA